MEGELVERGVVALIADPETATRDDSAVAEPASLGESEFGFENRTSLVRTNCGDGDLTLEAEVRLDLEAEGSTDCGSPS